MATNLHLDPALVEAAVAAGGCKTKKEAVTEVQEAAATSVKVLGELGAILPIDLHGRV